MPTVAPTLVSTKPLPTHRPIEQPKLPSAVPSSAWVPPAAGHALFQDGISSNDPHQGSIGDCYFIATLSALAVTQPEVIRRAIRKNDDGSYTVRLYERVKRPGTRNDPSFDLKERFIRVDGSVATGVGRSGDPAELWVPLLEKAFAKLKGGYDAIGSGGLPHRAMQALTGKQGHLRLTMMRTATGNLARIEATLARGGSVAAATWPRKDKKDGLVPNHAYSVVGAGRQNGADYIELRNPWGHTEPGHDGRNDGVFRLTPEQFRKRFPVVFFD